MMNVMLDFIRSTKILLTVINSNLDTTVGSKTPRTLLELVEYMPGHAPAIENGTFPDDKPVPDLKPVRFNHFNHIKANDQKRCRSPRKIHDVLGRRVRRRSNV